MIVISTLAQRKEWLKEVETLVNQYFPPKKIMKTTYYHSNVNKKKLLITGASGFLGWNLCHLAMSEWNVYGLYHRHETTLEGVTFIKADISKYTALKQVFIQIQPDAVIHAAAISQANTCQQYPSETRKINVEASISIAGLCADLNIACVFISSDLVFDGLHPPYSEESELNPVCIYGEQKVAAEHAMAKRYPETAICRMPLMFGYTQGTRQNFDYSMIQILRKGKPVSLFTDEYRTPVDAESATSGLLMALNNKITGILHLGGKTRISRYDMGLMITKYLHLEEPRIIPVLQKDIATLAPRPPDVSLNSSKAYAIGYDPMDIEKAIALCQVGM